MPKLALVIAAAICTVCALLAADRLLTVSRSYGQYIIQGKQTPTHSARAVIRKILPDNTAEIELLGRPRFDGIALLAKLPKQYRTGLQPGTHCVATIAEEGGQVTAEIVGPLRERALLVLLALVLLTLVLTMGAKGLRTLCALGLAAFLMLYVFLPLVIEGWNPIWIAIGVSAVVCATGIPIIGGYNRKSCHAISGAIGAVVLAGWIPWLLSRRLLLTGLDVGFGLNYHLDVPLWYSVPLGQVDFAGVLVAGMLVSGLGAVMDLAMTVSTSIAELREAAPHLRRKQLATSGMAVGKDVLGVMAITLFFVYVGTNLETFLLTQMTCEGIHHWGVLLDHEEYASEVIRLVGCGVGLVLAIPLTALAACWGSGGQPGA